MKEEEKDDVLELINGWAINLTRYTHQHDNLIKSCNMLVMTQ